MACEDVARVCVCVVGGGWCVRRGFWCWVVKKREASLKAEKRRIPFCFGMQGTSSRCNRNTVWVCLVMQALETEASDPRVTGSHVKARQCLFRFLAFLLSFASFAHV